MFKAALKLVTLLVLFCLPQAHAAISINSARVWPAQDYTRLTLESKQSIRNKMFTVNNPERLVIDLEEVELGSALNNLIKLIDKNDPYIKSVRVGRFKPGVVRLVLDLKAEVKPQLFVGKIFFCGLFNCGGRTSSFGGIGFRWFEQSHQRVNRMGGIHV